MGDVLGVLDQYVQKGLFVIFTLDNGSPKDPKMCRTLFP